MGTDREDFITAQRVAELVRSGILDSAPEQGFDDIVLLASRLCETPVSLVSLVDKDRQWFKARIGFPHCETPLSQSVCAHALVQDDVLIIPDLETDSRTSANTLVTGEPGIRFYAGAVLKAPNGLALGTLCVIDTLPRPDGLTDPQIESLKALARQVENQMQLRSAIIDRDFALAKATQAERDFAASQLLVREELSHRLKNILAIAQSIVSQSFRGATDLREVHELILKRIEAIAKAQDILVTAPAESVDIGVLVRGATDPHNANRRIELDGVDLQIGPKASLLLALTLHELATNATKYGSLSVPDGQIRIKWGVEPGENGPHMVLAWTERGGPSVTMPTRRGFGTRLIETAFAVEVGGNASIRFETGGLEYHVSAPVSGLSESA